MLMVKTVVEDVDLNQLVLKASMFVAFECCLCTNHNKVYILTEMGDNYFLDLLFENESDKNLRSKMFLAFIWHKT